MRKYGLLFALLAALGLMFTPALPSLAQQKSKTLLQGWVEELGKIGKKAEPAKAEPAKKVVKKKKKKKKKAAKKPAAKKPAMKDTKKDAKK